MAPSEQRSDEHDTEAPQLKFAEEHIEPILAGRKEATIRLGLDCENFQLARRFHLCDEEGQRFASAHVDDRGYTDAESIVRNGIRGHRSYRNVNEFLDEMGSYYPEADLDEDTLFEIVYWDWEELWE